MNSRHPVLPLLLALCVIQLSIPLAMIGQHEFILRQGRQFRFHTAPVDPYDALRGRYVAVRPTPDEITLGNAVVLKNGQWVHAILGVDNQGFACWQGISRQKPKMAPYLTVRVRGQLNNKVTLDLPFTRYYLEETTAPAAEKAYREHARATRPDAVLVVRVHRGRAVLEDLLIAGQPIRQWLKEQSSR